MMSIGMHCRLLGPGRMRALQRFLDHTQSSRARLGLSPHRHRPSLEQVHPFDPATAFVWEMSKCP